MRKIPLSKFGKNKGRFFAIVDDEDYAWLSKYNWHITGIGRYPATYFKHRKIKMHNLIICKPENKFIDHINRDKLDNRKSNLRLCTKHQNLCNRKKQKNNTSGYTGVTFDKKTKKWVAFICYKRKNKIIGLFINKEEAARKRDKYALKYFGEFASLNFEI